MAIAEPLPRLSHFEDDGPVPTPAQQALAEQRLAEMIADPSSCESIDSLVAYAKSLMR